MSDRDENVLVNTDDNHITDVILRSTAARNSFMYNDEFPMQRDDVVPNGSTEPAFLNSKQGS